MPQSNRDQPPAKKQAASFPPEPAKKSKQKSEHSEVAGRHKSDGQKDRKGMK